MQSRTLIETGDIRYIIDCSTSKIKATFGMCCCGILYSAWTGIPCFFPRLLRHNTRPWHIGYCGNFTITIRINTIILQGDRVGIYRNRALIIMNPSPIALNKVPLMYKISSLFFCLSLCIAYPMIMLIIMIGCIYQSRTLKSNIGIVAYVAAWKVIIKCTACPYLVWIVAFRNRACP